jgi:hypothetical protein
MGDVIFISFFSNIFLPYLIVIGVKRVKIAVDKMPMDSVYFPPYFADKIAPGM